MIPTKQFNARLPVSTHDQIDDLAQVIADKTGLPRKLSQASVVAMAVERMANAELGPKKNLKKSPKNA